MPKAPISPMHVGQTAAMLSQLIGRQLNVYLHKQTHVGWYLGVCK